MTAKPTRIGNVEIQPLLDAALNAPIPALFPKVAKGAWLQYAEFMCECGENAPMSITQFLLRSGGKTILVDSGIGAKGRAFFPDGNLPDAMSHAGVKPGDVDTVLCSHMHIDHVGWHTTKQGDDYVPTFPNAKCVFVREEYEYWTNPEVAHAQGNEHIVDCVLPLDGKVEIELVDKEQRITDEITLIPAPGHTVAHSAIGIVSGDEAAVIWGDLCHHPAQVGELWSPVFDMNPEQARESRDRLLQRIEDENRTVLAGHFAHPGVGRIVRVDGKRWWRAV